MYCSISGSVAQHPVVSKTTGFLYDRGLIEKLLQSNGGKCPHTGVDMTIDDLITVRTLPPTSFPNGSEKDTHSIDQVHRQEEMAIPTLTNIPSILKHLQNEWDGKAIEIHHLRKSLQETRHELATALYRVDASQRVIVKLQESEGSNRAGPASSDNANSLNPKEQVQVHSSVVQAKQVQHNEQILSGKNDQATITNQEQTIRSESDEVASKVMPDTWIAAARTLSTQLMTTRKARVLSDGWAQTDEVAMMSVSGQCEFDNEEGGNAVTCIKTDNVGNAFVGLENGNVDTLKVDDMTIQQRGSDSHWKGGRGGVNALWWDESQPNRVLSGGVDGLLRVWGVGEWNVLNRFDTGCEVVGIERHPERSVCFIGGSNYWTWHDLEHEKAVARGSWSDVRYECSSIHPDGLMFAMGCANGIIEMWDVASANCLRRLGEKGGKVHGLAMSEKGYYMASCRNGVVELWDLRKRDIVGKVDMGMDSRAQGVALDGMGEFGCGVGNGMASLFVARRKAKTLSRLPLGDSKTEFNATTRLGVTWGADAKLALVGGAGGMVYKVSAAGKDSGSK